jgi:hypothetical protein
VVITKEEYVEIKKKQSQGFFNTLWEEQIRQYEQYQAVKEELFKKLDDFRREYSSRFGCWQGSEGVNHIAPFIKDFIDKQILPLVAVLDSDQKLPDYWTTDRLYPEGTNTMRHVFTQEQQKAIRDTGWRKVIL